ncbi:unnamed protein product [Phytophthora fragariaefolia]|uniref:Unnamed protein product n=1 Tax=Phytophthora fragariaefolia TaxID=1490495 RepID=A0A9W6X9X7_9STRA|nr:unnamed protein product [Phytophthora fragariaefolia]
MWEQVAAQYNANRTRSSPERDFESLRRKFKSLYCKAKPTGQGEVPLRLRPVVWAKELQVRIEEAGGVHTLHDGLDGGEDDMTFEAEVDEATNSRTASRSSVTEQPSFSTVAGGGFDVSDDVDSDGAKADSGDESDVSIIAIGDGNEGALPGTSQARGGAR